MTSQFVDLFDRNKYGLNYWAGIAVCVGILVEVGFNMGSTLYNVLVDGARYTSAPGEPLTLGGILVRNLRYGVSSAVEAGIILVASATLLKKDLHLPFVAGVLAVLLGIVVRLIGLHDAPAFGLDAIVSDFAWVFLMFVALVISYHFLRNKLMALSLGMALGSLLMWVYISIRYDYSIAGAVEPTVAAMCTSFIAGVFLFAGIARHFTVRGLHFGEYGLTASPEGVIASSAEGDATPGKTRRPLVTLLLMMVTLNLYWFGWIYQIYTEIRRRQPAATSITPGKALGFLFIPIFNIFWALLIFIDHPKAIEKMQLADPPSGVPPQQSIIAGCMIAGAVAGLIGAYLYTPALYMQAVLLWTGMLLAQSALNSHWLAHRQGGGSSEG